MINTNKIKNLIIFGLFAVIILMRTCSKPVKIIEQGNNGEVIIKTIVDTIVEHKTHVDTIKFVDTVFEIVEIPIPAPMLDSTGNSLYEVPYEDSLLSFTIQSVVDGTLVSQNFSYTPKFPQYIFKTDSIFTTIEKETIIEQNKRQLFLGAEVGGNNTTFSFSPMVSLKDKKRNLYSFRYDMFNRTFNLGYQRQIRF